MGKIYAGQVVKLRFTIAEDDIAQDISGASSKKLRIMDPDDVVVEKDVIFYGDGTDGVIQYTTVVGVDLGAANDPGGWFHFQPWLILPSGFDGPAEVYKKKVYPNLVVT